MNRYRIIIWRNDGSRYEHTAADQIEAYHYARQVRILAHRTVKIAYCENTTHHWSRSMNVERNHWVKRSTADEFFAA